RNSWGVHAPFCTRLLFSQLPSSPVSHGKQSNPMLQALENFVKLYGSLLLFVSSVEKFDGLARLKTHHTNKSNLMISPNFRPPS
ncbi:unnamed protein product, partial [Larinioides sclopetarius]